MVVHRCYGTLPWQPIFGFRWAIIFGCMIANDRLFDFNGGFFGVKQSDEDIDEIQCLRVVALATNFGTKVAIASGFV